MSMQSTAQSQRDAILKHIREIGALSTLKARNELGIMHPGGRVLELRGKGYQIATLWRLEHDAAGVAHRIAEYVLLMVGDEAANDTKR